MKLLLIIASLSIVGCIAYEEQELYSRWAEHKTIHGKSYTDNSDEQIRYQLWQENLKFVDAHNARYEAGEVSYYMAQNRMSDLTAAERKQRDLCTDCVKNVKSNATRFQPEHSAPLPASVDWRSHNVVNPVKDQGHECGSSWAFSAVATLESLYALQFKQLYSFSEQEFIDCMEGVSCGIGGQMYNAFIWLRNKGLQSDKTYPYTGKDGTCKYDQDKTILNYARPQHLWPNEQALQTFVALKGPISVAIDATDNFHFYKGGVFNDATCLDSHLNRGVTVVGYGTEGGKDYYIVRNSWGAGWGEAGYIRMSRNLNNQCGIASAPCYAKLTK